MILGSKTDGIVEAVTDEVIPRSFEMGGFFVLLLLVLLFVFGGGSWLVHKGIKFWSSQASIGFREHLQLFRSLVNELIAMRKEIASLSSKVSENTNSIKNVEQTLEQIVANQEKEEEEKKRTRLSELQRKLEAKGVDAADIKDLTSSLQ